LHDRSQINSHYAGLPNGFNTLKKHGATDGGTIAVDWRLALLPHKEQFDGNAYQLWALDMESILDQFGLLGAVKGTDNNAESQQLARSILIRNIRREVKVHITQCTTAKEVSDTLQIIFNWKKVI